MFLMFVFMAFLSLFCALFILHPVLCYLGIIQRDDVCGPGGISAGEGTAEDAAVSEFTDSDTWGNRSGASVGLCSVAA